MANKRFAETQDAGELARRRRENLKTHPMSLPEALRIVAAIHTGPDGRPLIGAIPDFTKMDGDLYAMAWQVIRKSAGI